LADFPVDALAEFGLNKDTTDYRLKPEEWTDLVNIRPVSNKLQRMLGHEATFGTPPQAPAHWFPIITGAAHWWIWMSLARAYVWDGSDHINLTPGAGDFTAAQASDWQATILGGIPIINNGTNKPHTWTLDTGDDFEILANWPDTYRAKVIRALGPWLFYGNVTDGGTRLPHRVGWGHPAAPGSLPSSYDPNDSTKDSRHGDLTDVEAGEILEMLPLKGRMFVYKEAATHVLSFAGGQSVWRRDDFLVTSGILAPRCAGITGDGQLHFVVSQDNILVHDGARATELLDRRLKRWLFNNIDPVSFGTSFVFTNPRFKEMWLCYPERGAERPSRALIWNYELGQPGKFHEADVPYTWGSSGSIETAGGDTWETVTGTWDTVEGVWSQVQRRRTIVGYEPASKFYLLDETTLRDGSTFSALAQRTALAVEGRTKDGEPIVDFKSKKLSTRCWIRGEGDQFNFRIGVQDRIPGPVTWSNFLPFDPETDLWVDFEVEGRALSVEFSSTADVDWGVAGYTLEIFKIGNF
jgi:hypothetical protein